MAGGETSAVRYELALVFLHMKQLERAEKEALAISSPSPTQQMLLAQIYLAEGKTKEAQTILLSLDNKIEQEELSYYEWAYLMGDLFYTLEDYPQASTYFLKALPKRHIDQAPWNSDTLYKLGWSYFKQSGNVDKAIETFKTLYAQDPSDKVRLALAQALLINHKKEGLALLQKSSAPEALWLRAQNELEEGTRLAEEGRANEARKTFKQATHLLQTATDALKEPRPDLAVRAAKLHAESCCQENSPDAYLKAHTALSTILMSEKKSLLTAAEDPAEFYYLDGVITLHLAKNDPPFYEVAEKIIQQGIKEYPQSPSTEKLKHLLGKVQFFRGRYEESQATYIKVAKDYVQSPLTGEAYFWAAKNADQLQPQSEAARDLRRNIFENYAQSPYAAEAYFFYYPYRDYVQGNRTAIKHLQGMKEKFPDSPYTLTAFYLIGMDLKRDRKSDEGRWIRRKNMNEAIESLQEAESAFDALYTKKRIPPEELRYFIKIRYRATLERALANLAIADESQGAKKQIFLEYTQEVLNQLIKDFEQAGHPLTKELNGMEPYPHLLEESSYWLAQAYEKSDNDDAAEKMLKGMLDKYKAAKITRGYFLSRVHYELALIAMRRHAYTLALDHFALAEDTAKGKLLSTDQKIDLWIQQSLCYKELKETDKAMLLLSKAINDDAISGLRVKAMFLRADIYDAQGRQELARKQLEATSKKGGEWALKAKQKLVQDYGYQSVK